MNVVFTGAARDGGGGSILRADLTAAAVKAGFVVRAAVDKTVLLLVASRDDTVKAKNAKKLGVEVMTYPQFLTMLGQVGVHVAKSGAAPDPYVDEVPDFTASSSYGGLL